MIHLGPHRLSWGSTHLLLGQLKAPAGHLLLPGLLAHRSPAAPREVHARGLIILEDSLHIFVRFCALELNNEFTPGGEPLPPAGGGGMLV